MYFIQILLVILGVLVYVAKPQQLLYPQGKGYELNKEVKQTENNKIDTEHANSEQIPKYIANVPRAHNNSEQNAPHIGVYKTLLQEENKGRALNDTVTLNRTVKARVEASNGELKVNQTLQEKTDELTSGAITRGILVFVVLSLLFILYVGIKTCRKKSLDKRLTIVRKYGVRARRSDVEMEPLPLSDDDDDETVFDLTASRGNKC